ncbi:MAG: elongation factor Ts [Acidobacteria bacterium]|nr:MAG: elongation factor Ts [Acidobacteriota bacterium]RLE21121.1 MAG: elongation factor Ts [Acidobacteriota bacterium]
MANITASQVKELREKTGLSMGECKKALVETGGDIEEAVTLLRKKGLNAASKKAGRKTAEGLVGSYIHSNGKLGVLVEVNCETDFVARNEAFQELVKDLAMHIAASEPRFVRKEDVTEELMAKEKEIYMEQIRAQGKPENIVEKIVTGKMSKFYEENCLLEQAFVKNPDISVGQLISSKVAEIGENIQVNRFVRFKIGE